MARMFGASVRTVPASNYGHDLPAMLRAITPQTRVLFVANPNNPTGTLAPAGQVLELVRSVPSHVLLAMDEAYLEFLDEPLDLVPMIRDQNQPNLLLMRTFSKIYGLAGLRLGYGIGPAELITACEKVRQPFNINTMAQVAALAALDDLEHVNRTRQNNRAGLALFEQAFKQWPLEYVPSAANFILVRVGDGQRVFVEMQKRGVIVPSDGRLSTAGVRPHFHRHSRRKRALPGRLAASARPITGMAAARLARFSGRNSKAGHYVTMPQGPGQLLSSVREKP